MLCVQAVVRVGCFSRGLKQAEGVGVGADRPLCLDGSRAGGGGAGLWGWSWWRSNPIRAEPYRKESGEREESWRSSLPHTAQEQQLKRDTRDPLAL
ncbi:hypothetical protein MATL_G00145800 [Megalops atlanticus]|uniref:Uncharacterized protein n=1 Tax=Megalops atlanticus TaxID=7932 RepID=A0A9D3PV72_MEGAT|nr:hypothetical protein MATL_G00145800 [Megalops atlanticus]